MKSRVLATSIVIALVLAPPGRAEAADAAEGKQHFAVCATCHGGTGEGQQVSGAPRLAGQYQWYLTRQLENFRAGVRGAHAQDTLGQQMAMMASTLPDGDAFQDVAAYVAGLQAPAPARTEPVGDPLRGKELFTVCAVCHGSKAEGSPAQNAPRLAGQHDWYLVRQLRNFRSGLRGADGKDGFGQLMEEMAGVLPDEQAVLDVVAYIATLP